MDDYVVYGIRRIGSYGYAYIGISKVRNNWSFQRTAEKRLLKHLGEASRGTHYNKALQQFLNRQNSYFVVDVLSVLHDFDLKEARREEAEIIKSYAHNRLLNIIKDNNSWRPSTLSRSSVKRFKPKGSGHRAISKRYGGIHTRNSVGIV